MAFKLPQLWAKANAAAASLAALSGKERDQPVTTTAMDDYNQFRLLVIDARPDLDRLLPPKVETIRGSYGVESPNASYQDLQTFYAQIAGILKSEMVGPMQARVTR